MSRQCFLLFHFSFFVSFAGLLNTKVGACVWMLDPTLCGPHLPLVSLTSASVQLVARHEQKVLFRSDDVVGHSAPPAIFKFKLRT